MTERNIKELIPQREPIIMIDRLVNVEGDRAETVLALRSDNFFIEEEKRLEETGLIEHIA